MAGAHHLDISASPHPDPLCKAHHKDPLVLQPNPLSTASPISQTVDGEDLTDYILHTLQTLHFREEVLLPRGADGPADSVAELGMELRFFDSNPLCFHLYCSEHVTHPSVKQTVFAHHICVPGFAQGSWGLQWNYHS